jgi:Family of unknown function (DUF6151)
VPEPQWCYIQTVSHPLQCQCGTVKGLVANPRSANHCTCYCKDCQAFAHFLGRPGEILDERGGSDIVQTLPKNITVTQGSDSLACMRLTPKGLLRWYAACCNTPIGNTLSTPKFSFIGLVHTCLEHADQPIDQSFGPVRTWVNGASARGDPKPKDAGLATTLLWFVRTVLRARINGDYRHTPFFRADTGAPIATPRILSTEELGKVMSAVQGTR